MSVIPEYLRTYTCRTDQTVKNLNRKTVKAVAQGFLSKKDIQYILRLSLEVTFTSNQVRKQLVAVH
jgi:hypothetical protein